MLKKYTIEELSELFSVNSDLARLNFQRFHLWQGNFETWAYAPALLTFKGEVFRGAESWNLSEKDLNYAQDHLRILSGLFGVLAPLDNIQPYRLEMGIPLSNRRGENLYLFWRKTLTNYFKQFIRQEGSGIIINLASKEYTKAIELKSLNARVLELSFKDFHNGTYKFLTVYGKHARGLMTRFIIQNQIEETEQLKAFDLGAYVFNEKLSKSNNLTFTRG